MVKDVFRQPEILFFSRLHIDKKSGQYKEELSARVIERDSKGRFKASKTVRASTTELTKLQEDISKGKLSFKRAKGILQSLYDKPLEKRLKIAKDNFYSILVDNFKNISDMDKDTIEYLFNQMSIEDFDKFYQRNKELSNKVYGYGGYSEKDTQYYDITGKVTTITHAPLSPENMKTTAKDVIKQLKQFYGLTEADIKREIKPVYYNAHGRRIIDGRIYNWEK